MGSPVKEKEREPWAKETQDKVLLTEGFWLGETTVTQALWQAVTGNNPSHFDKNEQNPVEKVSWDDSITFIQQLNDLLAQANGLMSDRFTLRLPFEAEWEYACRAGTTTPFSFGENITTDQVNYEGDYPYDNAEKGESREKTVAVKSLLCNAWGLYEMHGNVWEWCQDWFVSDLCSEAVTNPRGAEEGTERVFRGGSWDRSGRFMRSAMRAYHSPDFRDFSLGLRLALGGCPRTQCYHNI